MSRKRAPNEQVVNERALHFLKVLVERYIQGGHPIGSRALAKDAGMDLSPATIRNVMADLEDMGLVSSPHTSSGRIPTASGYRIFLDCLITLKQLDRQEVEGIRSQLDPHAEPAQLIASATQLLSAITHMAGVVRLPRRERTSFRQIELMSLSNNRVLAILVTNEGEVHNRILYAGKAYSASELERAANYLNSRFLGRDLEQVRAELVRDLRDTRRHMDQLMAEALEIAGQVVGGGEAKDDFVIAGQTNLMEFGDLASMERLKGLFQAFTEKQEILHLLDRCMQAEGVRIFVGSESGFEVLDGCSVVTAPYKVDDQVVGVLGVIGPTRMAYERVIPIVDATARLLGAALKHR